jgi:hypothetical protein
LGQIRFAGANRLYHDLTALLTYVNGLTQAEMSGFHDTARYADDRAIAPFLYDYTHDVVRQNLGLMLRDLQ